MSTPNAKEIGDLLDTVTYKLPKFINGLIGTLYSAEAGKNMGQAVGSLYNELIESGIPKEDAIKMAKDYMLSLKDLTNNMGDFTK